KGQLPREIYANTLSEQTDLVAKEIKKLVVKNSLGYKDIAILVRANLQADPFLRALNMKGVPHKFVGSFGLYKQQEIRILIAFLDSLTDLEDSLQLFTLATSEIYELPMQDALAANSFAKRKGKSLHWVFSKLGELKDELEIGDEGVALIEKINSDLQSGRALSRKQNIGSVLFDFLKKTKYLSRLEQEGNVEAEIKVQNIARFFDKIREFSSLTRNETASAFVQWLEVMRGVGDDPATSEFDPETNAGQQLIEAIEEDKTVHDFPPLPREKVRRAIENMENLLSRDQFEEIMREIEGHRRSRPHWYSLFGGPSNLRELAQYLQRHLQYEVLYRQWSQSAHAQDFYPFIAPGQSGEKRVRGLRDLASTNEVVTFAATFLIDSTRLLINKFHLGELWGNWYIREVRDRYLAAAKSRR
ncbi:MAG: hypothetical protein IIC78_15380, partial [Chloroflexi bacterium]|nr:hypothetical protein [Chloroflexota bacterium]